MSWWSLGPGAPQCERHGTAAACLSFGAEIGPSLCAPGVRGQPEPSVATGVCNEVWCVWLAAAACLFLFLSGFSVGRKLPRPWLHIRGMVLVWAVPVAADGTKRCRHRAVHLLRMGGHGRGCKNDPQLLCV